MENYGLVLAGGGCKGVISNRRVAGAAGDGRVYHGGGRHLGRGDERRAGGAGSL